MKNSIFIFLFSISIFGQQTNKLDEKGLKNGIWKGIHTESKRPRYEGMFEHGKEKGTFKFFDDTSVGTLIATREFSDNDNSCYTTFFNQKNNKVSEGKEVNKLNDGEWKYYHEDSKQIMILENYAKGKLEGIKKVFYASGKIAQETYYKNGLKEGSDKRFDEKGIVLEESNFKNNQFDGLAIFRSPDNVIVAKGSFKNGKKIGIWEFNTNGKKTKENYNFQSKRKFAKRKLSKME